MGGMFGGGAAKAAREQARATREAAEQQAKQARESARAAQMQSESINNRQKIADAAKALEEGQDRQTVEVNVAPEEEALATDEMGRRRRARDVFNTPRGSGLSL